MRERETAGGGHMAGFLGKKASRKIDDYVDNRRMIRRLTTVAHKPSIVVEQAPLLTLSDPLN
jgi:hypothetical protein